jgi:Carboxypeptidase regulatory-like domain
MRAIIARSTLVACASLLLASALFAQTPPVTLPGSVTLPLVEYDKLVERAAHPPAPAERPPVAAAVARADLQVRLSAATVRGVATVQGEVLREGRVKVPLLDGAPMIGFVDIQQAGVPVPVVTESGTTSAILSGPGPFTLTISFGTEVTTEPGRVQAVLPAMRAGTVHATIEAPGDNVDVRVDRGLAESRSSSAGKTIVNATLQPRVLSVISWSSRDQGVRTVREARLVTDVKTLVTVAETDLRVASLFDVNVLQGQPEQLDLQVPEGFDVVSVSGGSVETAGRQGSRLALSVREPARRRHQFLLTLERTVAGGVQHAELPAPGVQGTQRETGEIAWEAVGTVDLTATESGPLRRLDVSEVTPSLSSLARAPLLAAFRYQRRADERVPVAFDVRRFADAPVLGAIAEDATVTTLVSAEGRALTEIGLLVRNRGQLFMKVGLPKGVTLLTAEVSGQPVKPVDAPDGARVPLVRPGFRPSGSYDVSFVYVESGSAFGKKGEAEMKLPRLDLPVEVLHWEVFLPDRYKVKRFDGDAMPESFESERESGGRATAEFHRTGALPGDQFGGTVTDATGAIIPGATVTITQAGRRQEQATNEQGRFLFPGLSRQPVNVTVELSGFTRFVAELPQPGISVQVPLQIGSVAETVQVVGLRQESKRADQASQAQAPSQNVVNLQQRVSGVLPVRIDVPRSGQSFRFIRPLVLDEETVMRFEYKMR